MRTLIRYAMSYFLHTSLQIVSNLSTFYGIKNDIELEQVTYKIYLVSNNNFIRLLFFQIHFNFLPVIIIIIL